VGPYQLTGELFLYGIALSDARVEAASLRRASDAARERETFLEDALYDARETIASRAVEDALRERERERGTRAASEEEEGGDSGAFYTLVPIRPRRRCERRSLRTFAVVSLRPGSLAFNPRPRRLSTPTDAFQLHPDVRSYRTALRRRRRRETEVDARRRRLEDARGGDAGSLGGGGDRRGRGGASEEEKARGGRRGARGGGGGGGGAGGVAVGGDFARESGRDAATTREREESEDAFART